MMDDTIYEGGGEDFTNHRIKDDERNRGTGVIVAFKNGVYETRNVTEPAFFVALLIESFEFVLASFTEGSGECLNEPGAHTMKFYFLNGGFDIEIWLHNELIAYLLELDSIVVDGVSVRVGLGLIARSG